MQRVLRLAAALLLTACASRQNVATEEPRAVVPVYQQATEDTSSRSTLIYRTTSYPDPELAARGLGRLEITVRVADRPTQTIHQALVSIRAGEAAAKQLLTDQRGIVQFDSIAVGRYQLVVRRIGYGPAKLEAPVSPGCRTDVEVYIGVSAIGIAPPPPEPGRSTITTCRPER